MIRNTFEQTFGADADRPTGYRRGHDWTALL
jgi:hypothetical protein